MIDERQFKSALRDVPGDGLLAERLIHGAIDAGRRRKRRVRVAAAAIGTAALGAAAAAVLVAASGSNVDKGIDRIVTQPTPTPTPSSVGWLNQPPGKAAGDQVAQELVDAALLPPGSQRLTKSPIPVLEKPSTTIGNDNFLDHNAWWKVERSTPDLLSYLRAHPLKGLVLRVTGSGVSGFNQPTQYELEFDGARPLAGNPALQYTIVSAGAGASWVRVDGWSIWYPARPVDETAPATGIVVISITSGPTRTVTDPAVVARLAREFNGLLRATPSWGGGRACTAMDRTLSISFTKPGETSPTIVASQSGCAPLWTVRGPGGSLPILEDGGNLLVDATHLLDLPSDALTGAPPTK